MLAAGAGTDQSPLLAKRAERLTRTRVRKGLAAALESVREEARSPRSRVSAVVPTRRGRDLLQADAQLHRLIERLRDGDGVSAQGVALVKQLLSDGASPLYLEGRDGALARELEAVCRALDRAG